jgi:hypothetical protein
VRNFCCGGRAEERLAPEIAWGVVLVEGQARAIERGQYDRRAGEVEMWK